MAYRESKQFESFRVKLREAGASFGSLNEAKIGPDHQMYRAVIYREDRHGVPVVVIDSERDGYMLYVVAPSNKIEDDVTLLMEFDQ